MAGGNDRSSDDRAGQGQRASSGQKGGRDEQQSPELEQALRPHPKHELQGDMDENRNLTGSTTWETIKEEREKEAGARGDESGQQDRGGQTGQR